MHIPFDPAIPLFEMDSVEADQLSAPIPAPAKRKWGPFTCRLCQF